MISGLIFYHSSICAVKIIIVYLLTEKMWLIELGALLSSFCCGAHA